uniref:Uncharacterized protein n=1 Tax=Anguilla anguilla TaxID=7936 RepID=A0A0E9QQ60_ANGAN
MCGMHCEKRRQIACTVIYVIECCVGIYLAIFRNDHVCEIM